MDVVEYADYGTLSVGRMLIGLASKILILVLSSVLVLVLVLVFDHTIFHRFTHITQLM